MTLALTTRRAIALAAWTLMSSGCSDQTPARIVAPSDTVIVNTNQWTPLGVRVLNKRGQKIERPDVSFTASPDSVIQVLRDGTFSCHEDGVVIIGAASGAQHVDIPIRCDLVRRFSPWYMTEVVAGGDPAPLMLSGYGGNGRVIDPLRVRLDVSDSTVIRVRDGMVYGLKKGRAEIWVQSLGKRGGARFMVVDPPPKPDTLAPARDRPRH